MPRIPFLSGKPRIITTTCLALCAAPLFIMTPAPAAAASEPLGNGFYDHGVAAPISNHRGTVATVDAQGRNVVLLWLMDHRGVYALLMIDAETGKADQFPIPFNNAKKDSPFASILSSSNKFYTHFGDHFVEFDPVIRAFTFHKKTTPQMAMGMTEDDNGTIWSVTYPNSGVASYNPKTKEFNDYGSVYKQTWPQYQRYVAADDTGIVYFAVGNTKTQILAFDPATKKATPLIPEDQRVHGTPYVYRNKDGKVYGQFHKDDKAPWVQLYKGAVTKVDKHTVNAKPIITDTQALFHKKFPDGSEATSVDLAERKMTIIDANTSQPRTVNFDYSSEGAVIMATAVAPDGTISGGTAFPMRSFSYNPKNDTMVNRPAYGQWNTVAPTTDRFFVGGYPRGFLLEWDTSKPWVNTDRDKPESNPKFLYSASPDVYRTHSTVPLADGSQVIMAGTPDYGLTGGGLLFWDRKAGKPTVIKHTELLPNQSTFSMIELPGGKILGGSTTTAGTGGQKIAEQGELYILDIATKKIEWHAPLIPGTQTYLSFAKGPGNLIYGIADRKTFFVFDPAKREIIQKQDIQGDLGSITASQQGPRIFIAASNQLYLLLADGIAKIDTTTHKASRVAKSPTPIEGGGDYHNGRIYYSDGSHLYSYQLNRAQ